MKVELLQHSSLAICATAIRTCWQSQDKSDNGGEKDLALIDRVGNKFKHASTLEHLVMIWNIWEIEDDDVIISSFKEDNFSHVTVNNEINGFAISTNVRALQQLQLDANILKLLLPKEYTYLFV